MQRTRLSTLFDTAGNRLTRFIGNPWRRLSLSIISFSLGFFIGVAVATTAGQTSVLDVVGAALVLLVTEAIGSIYYGRRLWGGTQLIVWLELLNTFKIGMIYSLFLEAFKIAS